MMKFNESTLFVLLIFFSLFSCTKSDEEKAKELAEKKIKEILLIPDSYDLASIELDSAYAPYDTQEFFELSVALYDEGCLLEEALKKHESTQNEIELYNGLSQYTFYRQARDKYVKENKEVARDIEEHSAKMQKKAEKMRVMIDKQSDVIGIKAKVRYRAKNNNGDVLMGTAKIVFDKEIKRAICAYDMESDEYKKYKTVLDVLSND